jgi:serine/threonine protein kinase
VRYRLLDVQPEVIQSYGVRIGSGLYPVKQAFHSATGIPRTEFTTQTARRHLAALGFEITRQSSSHALPGEPLKPPAMAPGRVGAANAVSDWRDPQLGDIFAHRYRIIKFLGQGDRKRTYLALDTNLNRRVALALIKPDAMRSDPSGTRREAQTLGQAGNHRNVVTLHDQGAADGVEYLVFEYLPGGTLRDYLRNRQGEPLPLEEVIRLARELAQALSHVHQQGLIHRDIAPANVWLDEQKEAHIGDFDSAVKVDTQDTLEALPLTTTAYASPEEVAGKHLDQRSDLYSLGAILYEAATGRRLEPGPGKLAAPRAIRPDIPPWLNSLICKLLSRSPDKRPATADNVLKALEPAPTPSVAAKNAVVWAETLPFPLASILWHYEGEIDAQSKVDHLLNFFEALAEFLVAIELGAFTSDHSLFSAHRRAWFGASPDSPQPPSFRTPTFGTWVTLHQRLSKTCRHMLSGGEESARRCCALFAADDIKPLNSLMSRELGGILDTARLCRNEWRGHAGVTSLHERARHLGELGNLLVRTEDILGDSLKTWDLLQPGTTEYTGGVFNYTVTVLMGPNQAFRKGEVKIRQPLDTSRLYLLSHDAPTPLEVAPLVCILPGPRTGEPACYFYNRLKGSSVRWISYHFHAEAEIMRGDDYVVDFISELRAD